MDENTKHVVGSVQSFVKVLEATQCQRVLVIAEGINGEFHSLECNVTDGSMTAAQETRFIAELDRRLDRFKIWIRGARQLAAEREKHRKTIAHSGECDG